jgi:hypothetical protein
MTARKGKPRTPLAERFAALFVPEPNSGCWLWEGSINQQGYGLIWTNEHGGRADRAHRVSVRLSGRAITEAQVVRHVCDNPSCVNPDHLLVGDTAENVRDRVRRGRGATGDKHAKAKLTAEAVLAIRRDRPRTRDAARDYGVSRDTINDIKTRKTWRHI